MNYRPHPQILSVRLTDEEMQALRNQAEQANMSVSNFARSLLNTPLIAGFHTFNYQDDRTNHA